MNKLKEFIKLNAFRLCIFVPLICLEAFLIIQKFIELPSGNLMIAYWIAVAFVVMAFDGFVVMMIKSTYGKTPLFWVYILCYLAVLAVLADAGIGYNLKSIQGKSEVVIYGANQRDHYSKEVDQMQIRIDKYNCEIKLTTNEIEIHAYARDINDLNSNIDVLNIKLDSMTNTAGGYQIDSFAIIEKYTGFDKNLHIILFLSLIWVIIVLATILTAPALEISKPLNLTKINVPENAKQYLKNNKDIALSWVEAVFRPRVNETDERLLWSSDRVSKDTGIDEEICKKLKQIFAFNIAVQHGKTSTPFIKNYSGKAVAQYPKEKFIEAINYIGGQE